MEPKRRVMFKHLPLSPEEAQAITATIGIILIHPYYLFLFLLLLLIITSSSY